MEHTDFRIGRLFRTGSRLRRCTHVGTRMIAAIHLNDIGVNGTARPQTYNREEVGRAPHAEDCANLLKYTVARCQYRSSSLLQGHTPRKVSYKVRPACSSFANCTALQRREWNREKE